MTAQLPISAETIATPDAGPRARSRISTSALLTAAIAVVGIFYLIQIASPIRLDTDAVVYLTIAIGLADSVDFEQVKAPIGYPLIIAALDRIGLGSTPAILALNILGIGAGLAAVWWIARRHDPNVRRWTILLTLLSYPLIRTLTMPRPDAIYFGLSLVTIALISSVKKGDNARNVKLLAAAFALIAAGLTLRLAAVALIPPLIWGIMQLGTIDRIRVRWARLRVVAILVAIATVVAIAIAGSQNGTFARYRFEMAPNLDHSPLGLLWNRIMATLRGFGVLTFNFPRHGIPKVIPWIGLASAILLLARLRRRGPIDPIALYVVTYIAVLFLWPFFDIRLWVQVTPLLVLYVVLSARSVWKFLAGRIAISMVAAWFIFAGVGALGVTTARTFAGEKFRQRFGSNGGFSDPWHPNELHDRYAEMIIRRYDSGRAAWRWLEEGTGTIHPGNRIRW